MFCIQHLEWMYVGKLKREWEIAATICSNTLAPHVKKTDAAKIAPINFMPQMLRDKKHQTARGQTVKQLHTELADTGRYKNVETISARDVRVRGDG